MNTKQIAEISQGTCMVKGQSRSAHHLDSVQSPLQATYLLDYPFLFHKKVMLHHLQHSKHLYICGISLPHLTQQMRTHHFSTAHNDKINHCGF